MHNWLEKTGCKKQSFKKDCILNPERLKECLNQRKLNFKIEEKKLIKPKKKWKYEDLHHSIKSIPQQHGKPCRLKEIIFMQQRNLNSWFFFSNLKTLIIPALFLKPPKQFYRHLICLNQQGLK